MSILSDIKDKLDQIINTTTKLSNGISTTPKEFEVKVTKGNEITGSKYEVEIELEGKKVGAFSQIGYYFYDGNIYIYDHFKLNESVSLPWQYHHLKVIKTEDDDYKLVFCNQSGHEYYAVPDDYRFVGIKSIKNVDLAKYYNKNGSHPSFIAKASNDSYSHSQQRGVDIYDISNTKAVGSLINEFGYYDIQNKFHYTNYQMGTQNHSYDPPSFTITKGDNQCQLHKMKIGSSDHRFLNDTIDCSLVEYIANNVNNII